MFLLGSQGLCAVEFVN